MPPPPGGRHPKTNGEIINLPPKKVEAAGWAKSNRPKLDPRVAAGEANEETGEGGGRLQQRVFKEELSKKQEAESNYAGHGSGAI